MQERVNPEQKHKKYKFQDFSWLWKHPSLQFAEKHWSFVSWSRAGRNWAIHLDLDQSRRVIKPQQGNTWKMSKYKGEEESSMPNTT